ncbi:hypothetical protein EMIT074MI3_11475 [Bacillus licheniformis]
MRCNRLLNLKPLIEGELSVRTVGHSVSLKDLWDWVLAPEVANYRYIPVRPIRTIYFSLDQI